MIRSFLLLLMFFFEFPAAALKHNNSTNCDDLDFSEKMGPVRQQGNFGWCFAFTAADLIGYKFKLTPNNTVSAFDLGIGYYVQENIEKPKLNRKDFASEDEYLDAEEELHKDLQELSKRQLEMRSTPLSMRQSGDIDQAIRSYNFKGGLCTEKKLPSQKSEVFIDADQYLQSNLLTSEFGSVQSFNIDCGLQNDPFLNYSMTGGLFNAKPMAKLTEKTIEYAVLSSVNTLNQKCNPRIKMPLLEPVTLRTNSVKKRQRALRKINENITKRIPTGITYSSCFLTEGPEKYPTFFSKDPKCPHASSVVGRRLDPKTNKCEYKIRNSWGLSCEPYSEKIKQNKKCENGHVWVSEDELYLSLFSITWLP